MSESGQRRGSVPGAVTPAVAAVADRVFLFASAHFTYQLPRYLPGKHSGLVLGGPKASKRAPQLRGPAHQAGLSLLVDAAGYAREGGVASVDRPLILPDHSETLLAAELGMTGLAMDLAGQRNAGASAAIAPFGYVPAGDSPTLKAVVAEAGAIGRDDVIALIAVDAAWLKDEYLAQLIALINRIEHPVAIAFGAQKNDAFESPKAVDNSRRLWAETTRVGLWRADVLSGFDCLAYGGMFAAIGSGGSLRHLVPPGEAPQSGGSSIPTVLLPNLLRYLRADTIAERYANADPPRCVCSACQGRGLDRFNSTQGVVRAEAHAHSADVWASWLGDFFALPTLAHRQHWWQDLCATAVDAYEPENVRIQQPGAFKPLKQLLHLAGTRSMAFAH